MVNENLDIEEELIDHLANPESAMYIYKQQIGTDLLLKDEKGAHTILPFVIDHIEKYGKAPTTSQVVHSLGGSFSEPTTPVEWVVDQLRDRFERNRTKEIVSRLATLAVSDPQEAVRFGLAEFSDVSRKTSSHDGILDVGDWDRAISIYNKRVLAGSYRGFSFGFKELDEVTGGMRPNTMAFVCGRPKTGKSWILLKSAVANMLAGARVHFETMELREDEMYGRFQCMVAGISYTKYFKGRLTHEEVEEMREIGELIRQSSGEVRFVHPKPDARSARDVADRAKEWSPDIVLGDQFSFLTSSSKSKEKHERDSATVGDIKDHIASLFPTMWAAQFNREASGLTEMADLGKIGLTDAIGQACDIALGIHVNKEMAESRMFELGTIAARASEGIRGLVSNQIGMSGDLKWIEKTGG